MIHAAKNPYILVGGGAVISGAHEELAEFARKMTPRCCDTLMGKGAFDGQEGVLYRNGWNARNKDLEYRGQSLRSSHRHGHAFSDRCDGNAKKFAHRQKFSSLTSMRRRSTKISAWTPVSPGICGRF